MRPPSAGGSCVTCTLGKSGVVPYLGVLMARYTNKKVVRFTSGLLLQISRSDCFDLYQEAVMKRTARNYRACGAIFPKNSCVDFVERVPKIDVGNRDVHFDNAIPVAAGGF